jgi:hypothetical protein
MAALTGLLQTYSIDTTARSATIHAGLNLGAKAFDKDGNEYTYVLAQGTIAANAAARTGTLANTVLATSGTQQNVIGVATTAFADTEYGFLLTRGTTTALVANSTAAGSCLVSSATAGVLKIGEATDFSARGIAAVTSSGSSATAGAVVNLL